MLNSESCYFSSFSNRALYMNGKTVVISAWMVVSVAFFVTFPHDIASLTNAPLKLPSNSCAVVT